jgi:membrane protease YdiL (CAAX protease family)
VVGKRHFPNWMVLIPMKSADTPDYRSPIQRFTHFIRDFRPALSPQLLFPLGSFFLLLGASHTWYLLRLPQEFEAVLRQQNYQVDPNAYQRFTHAYQAWVLVEESIAMASVRFASFASLVLWCVSLRKIVSKFVAWVFLPAGLALTVFPMFLIATTRRRNAFVDAWIAAAHVPPPRSRPWFPAPNLGFYLAISGLIVLAAGLILVRRGKISLPLRFRTMSEIAEPRSQETSSTPLDISTFVIVMAVWTFTEGWALLIPTLLGMKPIYWTDRSFFVIQWAPALANAVAAAGLAFFLLRTERAKALARLLRRQPFRDYAFALGLPLGVVLLPRFLLGVAFKPYLEPDEWPALFLPHPLPSVLLVYVIAFFEEFAVRGYLQTTLERHLSLKRSIFLTGLLWSLFLGFDIENSLPYGAVAQFPGVSILVRFATLIIYSVPLGWLYARTRSIVSTALMHGTIVIFHVGVGQNIHLNHPEFYWMELALWIFIGWLLFRRYPLVTADASPVPDLSVS